MAVPDIAFEVPDHAGGARLAAARPIDLVHLHAQTMGDASLETEVLQLFARHARCCLRDCAAGDAAAVCAAAHRLKGAAAAVGAFAVAAAAAALEASPEDAASAAALTAAVLEAESFILGLCR